MSPAPYWDVDDRLWRVVAGSDATGWRDITEDVSGLTYSKVRPGGAASCSFMVPADVWGIGYNEVRADEQVIVSYAGHTVWDGVVLPRGLAYAGDAVEGQPPISVECTGMLARAKRRKDYARVFADADLGQWFGAEWENLTPGIQITRPGNLVFAAASGSVFPAASYQAVWYWLHSGLVSDQDISTVTFEWTSVGTMTWEVFEASEASVSTSWTLLDSGGGSTQSTPVAETITCSTGTQAVAIRCGWAATATLTYDNRVRIGRLQVNGQVDEATIGSALEDILVTPGIADSFYSASVWTAGGETPPPPVPPTGSVSVKDSPYSAAGDGSTDDYDAIMAACAALAGTGTALYFPAGEYYIGDHSGTPDFEPWSGAITPDDDVEWVGESVSSVLIDGTVFFGSDQKFSYMRMGRAGLCAIRNVDGAADTEFLHVYFLGGGGTPESYNAPVVSLGYSSGLQRITWNWCDVECNGGTESATLSNLYNDVSIYTYNKTVSDLTWNNCNIGVTNGTRSGSPRMGFECFVPADATYTFSNITLNYCTVECCDSHGVNFSDAVDYQATGVVVSHCKLKGGGLTYQTHEQWGSTIVFELTIAAQITDNEFWDGAERVIQQYQRVGYDEPAHVFRRNVIDLTQDNGVTRESYWVAVDLEGSSNVYPTTGADANVQIGS